MAVPDINMTVTRKTTRLVQVVDTAAVAADVTFVIAAPDQAPFGGSFEFTVTVPAEDAAELNPGTNVTVSVAIAEG